MENFPWFKHYPKGVSREIDPADYDSVIDIFEEAVKKFAHLEAYENMGKSISYKELNELSRDFAAYLQKDCGLRKGERIAIQMPNLLQFPIAMFGAMRAGLIVVNTNPLYTAREMEHQFKDSGATAIVIVENFAYNLQKIIAHTDIKHVIVTKIGDMLGGLKGGITNFVVKNIKKMVPAYKIEGTIPFKKALEIGQRHSYERPEMHPEDIAFLQYTGGTTGISKGAQLSHYNIVSHTLQINEWFHPLFKGVEQDIMITALPLYHIFALSVNGLLMLFVGAKNILITNPRDMKGFMKELKKHPFTLMTGVNTLFNGMIHYPSFKDVDFSHLKASIGGGMAVQRAVAEKWKEVTKSPLVEGYGLSETSPVLCCNPLDGQDRTGTIGLPMPSTVVTVMDEEGNEMPVGETGEICAKGPQVMKGYWQKPELNESTFFNGEWFRTGDMGQMDKDGYFRIVDRKKDMINVSGFNVYPNEVEDVLASHDKILEVAAIGVPDEKSTEVVKVFIVKKDPSLTEEEVKAYAKENLTGYKRPHYIEFRDELPKSNVGKILRRTLKEEEEAKSKK